MAGKRGGARPNSGPKKGAIYKPTLDKAQARELLRAVVLAHMDDMLASQIKHAKGLSYLVARHKASGKFEKLTSDEAEKLLNGEESDRVVFEVWEKDPSVQAFTDLMNRAIDKPAEQKIEIDVTVTNTLHSKVNAARERLQARKQLLLGDGRH